MSENNSLSREPMLEMFIFESVQLLEQLEEMLMSIERKNELPAASINEIFRIMHTIKGSSAMMAYDAISILAHSLEDLFDTIRGGTYAKPDCRRLTDIVLQAADFIKGEISKVESGDVMDGDSSALTAQIRGFNQEIKGIGKEKGEQPKSSAKTSADASVISLDNTFGASAFTEGANRFSARLFFEDGCLMENMRAYTVVHGLKDHTREMRYYPEDIADNEDSSAIIRESGFLIQFTSFDSLETMQVYLGQSMFLDRLELEMVDDFPQEHFPQEHFPQEHFPQEHFPQEPFSQEQSQQEDFLKEVEKAVLPEAGQVVNRPAAGPEILAETKSAGSRQQSLISVNTEKLDRLLDLVGEMVIAEAMVVRNPELQNLRLDGFRKAARQLGKLTSELQDIVMSIRMMPIAATFHRMQRIVRDMTQKLGKEVDLHLAGEDTELDKNIIDHIGDPLMHLIRNSLDHGIESPSERLAAGKTSRGNLYLEARSMGGDILITIRDDGRGLNREKILAKARERGLVNRPDKDYSDKEVFSFILLPGFSTKDNVSEFSGRGVGMDVVRENISKVGGAIVMDSHAGEGTSMTIRLPLTLAIINGMMVSVGTNRYIIPVSSIRESFRAEQKQIVQDVAGNEMVMIRGECISLVRLHRQFGVQTSIQDLSEGIIVVIEENEKTVCLFADELISEQQAVVKPLPVYVHQARGVAGCTILGDGRICLILDATGLVADGNDL